MNEKDFLTYAMILWHCAIKYIGNGDFDRISSKKQFRD